jgi:hypothetical protein
LCRIAREAGGKLGMTGRRKAAGRHEGIGQVGGAVLA